MSLQDLSGQKGVQQLPLRFRRRGRWRHAGSNPGNAAEALFGFQNDDRTPYSKAFGPVEGMLKVRIGSLRCHDILCSRRVVSLRLDPAAGPRDLFTEGT